MKPPVCDTILCLDIGNTWVKASIVDHENRELHYQKVKELTLEDIKFWDRNYGFSAVISSSTRHLDNALVQYLEDQYAYVVLDHNTPIPIENAYTTPETLGRDRLAAVIGAWTTDRYKTHLVIDAGTCITYDVLSNGVYLGGNIAPGMHMRLAAMQYFTDKLPLVEMKDTGSHLGTSTETALQNGSVLGTICEIESFILRTRAIYPDVKVTITGGDGQYLADRIESDIFVAPKLVLTGLQTILRYHAI